jgi:2-keto-4-pentenoate hydratase/2-oxohepta-3-ene-1,7-dioic acid hydratase in catechol pathway
MKLKRIRLKGDSSPSISIFFKGTWLPLGLVLSRTDQDFPPEEAHLATDMIALLRTDPSFRQRLERRMEAWLMTHEGDKEFHDDIPMLPFEPRSYRDFMLYERHAIDAARGYAKRFIPLGYFVAIGYERITGRTFPLFRPKKIWYNRPIYYMGNHLSFVTDNQAIPFPSYSKALDYELELGAVIVKPIRNATAKEALEAIGGFVVFNDFSARDVQLPEMKSGFGPAKAKHFANAISAVIVSADEILPFHNDLQAEVRINHETVIKTSTAGMHFTLGEAIAYASLDEQLYPGEFVATGTLPGCSGMENGHWLKHGDTIELAIDKIGTLTNPIL